ncbi:glucosamine-6-phosphate deaminase [Mycoplasmopsis caviae]|uniref:Glucosamine-6-phosphate deaminase n=1 Tax=Mycoplasmopsis caviae TaxID=55603 RepID=A0A3P8KA42_9BACT|nr:glucosamine-6-phosphate deaminase [Mycoplasmopsis caviae]UUD35680.1 glucosamine-6-phosphate deaminase [Mycoplasmopsis caviae]VDR41574.1 glucosamine-6-phosphate deaminase [Mycoplasmopsis caviae]
MKVFIEKNEKDVALKAYSLISKQLSSKADSRICFATGSTPIELYKLLIENYKSGKIDFSQVISFNLDEYLGLDIKSEHSYHYFMDHNLFNHINIKRENINFPDIKKYERDYKNGSYEKIIKDFGGIDFTILGIGENGHIAFNEPESKQDDITRVVDLTQSTINANKRFFTCESDVPRKAVTMGIGTILKSKQIILLATGPKKAQAIFDTLLKPISQDCPASFLQSHDNVTIIIDEESAKLIRDKF